MGSSVPAWPTLRVPSSVRHRATTSWLVKPAGLSTMSSPAPSRPLDGRVRGATVGHPAVRPSAQDPIAPATVHADPRARHTTATARATTKTANPVQIPRRPQP